MTVQQEQASCNLDSVQEIATQEIAKTQCETAKSFMKTGAQVEQTVLLDEVETKKAQQLIATLAQNFDGIIQIKEQTGNYCLKPNEFVYNYPNTINTIQSGEELVVSFNPQSNAFTVENGNIVGKSLFSRQEYQSLLETQQSYLQNEKITGCGCDTMGGLDCKTKKVTIDLIKPPKPCEAVQQVVNNYNVLMVLPGMADNECCFKNCQSDKPVPNIWRYENDYYRGEIIHGNQQIQCNFPEQEFHSFLGACNGQVDLNALTANQFATCSDIMPEVSQLRDQYPQYISQDPRCGFDLSPNQYALCNTFTNYPAQSSTSQESYMIFQDDVFPIAEYQHDGTHQVIIGGEACKFREPELVEFLETYNEDCQADLKEYQVNRDERYTEQYVDKKFENRAYRHLQRGQRIEQRASADYKHVYDKDNVKLQSLIDQYDNLLAACEDPNSGKVKRATRRIEHHREAMANRLERENKQYNRRMERAQKYKEKACKVATLGVEDLANDQARNQEKFEKDLNKKQGKPQKQKNKDSV